MAKEEAEHTLDTITELQTAEPFVPFKIVMASGDHYLIDNPRGLAIGESQVHYYPFRSDRAVHLRINQIVAVDATKGEKAGA